jgi:hypothetical protein
MARQGSAYASYARHYDAILATCEYRHRGFAVEEGQKKYPVGSTRLEHIVIERPVETLADEEVLALTELRLTPEEQSLLSDLLQRNSEGDLDADGQRQLDGLMRVYEKGLLRKAQALRVAVQRGLRAPLQQEKATS